MISHVKIELVSNVLETCSRIEMAACCIYIQTICVTSSCITYRSSWTQSPEHWVLTLSAYGLSPKITSLHMVAMKASDHIKRYVKN
jgi:hypothetical protein